MNNFEAIKQMPLASFANMVYCMATRDCKSEKEFEELLAQEIKPELEETVKEALQNMQCFSKD